jgi:putative ABC transport system permease protein
MSVRWNKILRDILQNKTRSVLAILAIAVGIAGFGAVLSTYSILTRELNAGYLATNPASATVWVNQIDDSLRQHVKGFPGIGQVEERRSISARVRVGAGEWRNAILFIIEDYNSVRISTLKSQAGKWPPDNGEILIERDAMGVARAKIGDELLIKMPEGQESPLRITGTVHDVGQAQARMEQLVYGYITRDTLAQLGADPFLDQFKIVVSEDALDEQHVESTISELKRSIESLGYTVRRVEIPKPGAHPHADLMGTLLLFKASFGFFALLLSGVLVLNLFSALMAGQIRQIGIMKAIGGRRKQVKEIYFGFVFVLSILALAIGIPAAMLGGRALSDFMSRFLNFDLQSYSIAFWVYGLETLAAIVVPFLAALYPVWKGSKVTVREAITDYGIRQQFGPAMGDRLLMRMSGATRPLLLSLRNTFRRRGRFILILATLATGGAIFIAAWNVRASMIRTVDVMLSSFRYNLSISFAKPFPIESLESVVRATPGVTHVESWAIAEAAPIGPDGSQGNPINIVAPPSQSKAMILNIVQGRNLRSNEKGVLVVNNALLHRGPEYQVGKEIRLKIGEKISKWQIVGVAQQPLAGSAAYANLHDLSDLTDEVGVSRNVRVITEKPDAAFVQQVKAELEKRLGNAGFPPTSSTSMAERRKVIDEHNSVIYMFLIVMSLLIVVVGSLGLMTVMSINVLERRREIGVMRAIGATRRKILWIVLAEGVLIGALSWIVAVALSTLISTQIGNLAAARILRTVPQFVMDPLGILLWLLLVLLFGAAASYLPARNAARLTVRQLVEYE